MRHTTTSRVARHVGLAFVVGAVAAPSAAAISPDAQERNERAALARQYDARSPDVRDYAQGRRPSDQQAPKVVTVPRFVEVTRSDRLAWDDVAIGAGGTLGLVLVAAGGAATVVRRRRHPSLT